MASKMVTIEVSKLSNRRFDMTPLREPGQGRKVNVDVQVYPETLEKYNGKGSKAKNKERITANSAVRSLAWRKLGLPQQLALLEKNIPEGATKQKTRIRVTLEKAKQVAEKAQAKVTQKVAHAKEVAARRTGGK